MKFTFTKQTSYLPDLLWVVIVCHLQLPSKINLINLVCLFGSLLGKLNFDKTRVIDLVV